VGTGGLDDARLELRARVAAQLAVQRSWLERTSLATGASAGAGAAPRIRSPITECWRMNTHSDSSNGPACRRMSPTC
jgi:hypothetical protein